MNNCDAPGLLPIPQAINNMLSAISTINSFELINLIEANNRVLAEDILSTVAVPPANNSAMDGYAIATESLKHSDTLELLGTSLAGQPFSGRLTKGGCVRIMTGAIIPEGANAVVMQEQTEQHGNQIKFVHTPCSGENIRLAGEDIPRDSVVIKKGTLLTPAHLSLIASVGVAKCRVFSKPKVAVIATGDELTPPGQALQQGGIYESNRFALRGLLENFGADMVDLGIIEDNPEALEKAFEQADKNSDLIISSGGVSVGDADYVKDVLHNLGNIDFWKVAIKPGKPFAFGKLNHAWFCGLPGNPVSSFVTFEQLVSPLLAKLSGQGEYEKLELIATTEGKLRKRPGRADFQRGIYRIDENGNLLVKANGKQGSGIMSSVANANCYILLDKDSDDVAEGTPVVIQPFVTPFR